MLNTPTKLYTPHLISVLDYHKMAETGILDVDAKVELIDGEIIDMAPIGSIHASYVNRLNRALVQSVGNTALVSVQNPVILGDLSEPEPDFALLRPKANDYEDSLPIAEDILLLIEVANTTVNYDTQIKAPLYARFSIPEYWLIDTQKNTITVFQNPVEGVYTDVKMSSLPKNISPFMLPNIKLNLG